MLKLFLLRHGKAANPEDYDQDYDRPLNKKGVIQINQVGFKLLNEENEIGQIISSSAKRTEETTLIANHFLNVKDVEFHSHLYLSSHPHIFGSLQQLAKADSVLYVGHNFGISDIVSYLTGENVNMSTGMLVEIEFEFDDWKMISKQSGRLIDSFAPDVFIP